MNDKKLENFLGLENDSDQLIDVKMSLGNITSAPSEILDQLKKVIKVDQEGLLNDFIDY
jgi:hypothetical protein